MHFEPACTPGQELTLRLDTAQRAAAKLTERDVLVLRRALEHPDGVINPTSGRYGNTERRMAKLVKLGVAIPNAHGDWYITETGRLAINQ